MPSLIPDDPVVRCMEVNGIPPWQMPRKSCSFGSGFGDGYDDEWEEDDDVYYGSETAEF